MITAGKAIETAVILLGYTNRFGEVDGENYSSSYRNALKFLNTVYVELAEIQGKTYTEITELTTNIELDDRVVLDVMVYGLAMWLAKNENDGDNQSYFAAVYSQKRGSVPRQKKHIRPVWGANGRTAYYKKV